MFFITISKHMGKNIRSISMATEQKSFSLNAHKSLLLNEILWGASPEQIQNTEKSLGITLRVNLENLYLCLTGINHSTIQKMLHISGYSYFMEYYKPCCLQIQISLQRLGYESVFFVPAFDSEQRICFLFSPEKENPDFSIHEAAKLIHQSICGLYSVLDLPADIYNYTVYSEKPAGRHNISKYYQKLCLLCDSMFFFPKSTILGSGQFVRRSDTIVYDMTRDISELEHAVADGDAEKAGVLLDACIWNNLCPIRSKNMLKTFVTIITEKINRIMYAYEIDKRLEESRLYPENFNNIEKFYRMLQKVIIKAAKTISESNRQLPPFLYEAILYIKEHIREDISLQNIADYVFVSPSHLSRSFNNYMGKGLSAYIMKERMKIASRLLCETEMTNAAVAAAVGIHSNSYFTRLFCEEYEMPPTEFRRLYSRKNIRPQNLP